MLGLKKRYSPQCDGAGTREDCFYACGAADFVEEAASVANARVLRAALRWVESTLSVRHVASAVEVGTDAPATFGEGSTMCVGLPLADVASAMVAGGADVAVVVTHRPSFTRAAEAKACARFTSTKALGRPAIIHLNLVPSYSAAAGIAADTELETSRLTLPAHAGVVDSVVHFLYVPFLLAKPLSLFLSTREKRTK